MAVAAPKRRSQSQAAPAPSRTAPPEPKKRPRDRPRAGGQTAAPARKPATPKRGKGAAKRKSPVTKGASAAKASAATAPARKGRSAGKATATAAPARKPARRKVAPRRRSPAGVIPIAAGTAGRAAVAVTQLPESGLIHRLTRGRAWIGVLGVLLVGIVALNVVTLSFAASAGKVDARNTELSQENSVLAGRVAQKYGQAKLRHEAAQLGLLTQAATEAQDIEARSTDVTEAAARLAAAAAGTAGAAGGTGEEASSEESATGEGAASGEASAAGEGAAAGEPPSEAEIAEMSQAEQNALYEETLANEAAAAEAATEVSYEETVTEAPAG